MKVLKEGTIQPQPPFKKTCGRCGCVFEFDEADLKTEDMFIFVVRYVECPTCKKEIRVL